MGSTGFPAPQGGARWFDLFPARLVAAAISVLCVSYVVGGVAAAWLAGHIAKLSHNNWRAIMGLPAAFLFCFVVLAWFVLPKSSNAVTKTNAAPGASFRWSDIPALFVTPAFLALCGLSFTTTLGREFFADWSVDYMKNVCNLELSDASKASSAFDFGGIAGIIGVGMIYGRINAKRLRLVLMTIFLALTGLLMAASGITGGHAVTAVLLLGGAGLLLYGPYSLLSGALAVDVRGKQYAATVAGLVDFAGYLAGATAGKGFGAILDHGGYPTAFKVLAGLMLLSAVLAFGVSRRDEDPAPAEV
jgi:sugar phosphate permease